MGPYLYFFWTGWFGIIWGRKGRELEGYVVFIQRERKREKNVKERERMKKIERDLFVPNDKLTNFWY